MHFQEDGDPLGYRSKISGKIIPPFLSKAESQGDAENRGKILDLYIDAWGTVNGKSEAERSEVKAVCEKEYGEMYSKNFQKYLDIKEGSHSVADLSQANSYARGVTPAGLSDLSHDENVKGYGEFLIRHLPKFEPKMAPPIPGRTYKKSPRIGILGKYGARVLVNSDSELRQI
jgi:hypothetical protein